MPPGVEHVIEPWHLPTSPGWVVFGLPRAAARARVQVLHAPAYTAPPFSPAPVVLTIHDVSYERHPEWYPYRRDGVRRAYYRWSARSAAHVLTDSAFSRSEIAAAYGIAPARITVAPLGVSPTFSSRVELPGVLPASVTTPFLLHVGDLHERRNLGVVVKAVSAARRALDRGSWPALVLAGVDRGEGDALGALARAEGAPEAVIRLGAVDEDTLRALYASAIALLYPSRYEGFGLPVLEAMASGTPVLASHAASMPEVLGEAGMLIDPDAPADWVEAIVRVISDDSLRGQMRADGIARAAAFTWARTAAITLNAYRAVLGRPA
jgi:alpha-1,3-rhamnosyl/mannosyltransferase